LFLNYINHNFIAGITHFRSQRVRGRKLDQGLAEVSKENNLGFVF